MKDTIPFVDLVGQYHRYKQELDDAIRATLESAAYIGGPALGRFEKAFAEMCGVKHAIGVANGTDAIELALRGLGVKAGDEVIVPANTFIATAEGVVHAGAKPVFVDVDERTAHLRLDLAEKAITAKTKAIIPVHLYGQLVEMSPLLALAKQRNLFVIEDAAQAHAAIENGKRAGAAGHAGCFSFYPGKNLGAYGDAGAIVTNDDRLADFMRRFANHGRADKFGHDLIGRNSRLDGMQAAILDVKLRHLETWTRERREAAKRYDRLLASIPGITLPVVRNEGAHVFHLYVIRVNEDRDALRKHLDAKNIQSGIHYPHPLHLLPAFAHLDHREGDFPVSERLAKEIVSLPMSPELSEEQQQRVADAVREYMR